EARRGALLPRGRRVAPPHPVRRGARRAFEEGGVTPRPLTVLHLVANRWWTGSAEPVTRLVLALRARGHRTLLALAGGDRFEVKAREAGVEPLEGLHLDVKSGPLAIVGDARHLRTLVARERVDVV